VSRHRIADPLEFHIITTYFLGLLFIFFNKITKCKYAINNVVSSLKIDWGLALSLFLSKCPKIHVQYCNINIGKYMPNHDSHEITWKTSSHKPRTTNNWSHFPQVEAIPKFSSLHIYIRKIRIAYFYVHRKYFTTYVSNFFVSVLL